MQRANIQTSCVHTAVLPLSLSAYALAIVLLVGLSMLSIPAHAEKTTIIQPAVQNQEAEDEQQNPNNASTEDDTQQKLKNTLAAGLFANDTDLSLANQELLAKNAHLERELNDLQTQVNVLVNERSGQLFMYGVFTTIGSFLAGGFLSWLVFGRRNSW